jgi:hypothetical protein
MLLELANTAEIDCEENYLFAHLRFEVAMKPTLK